MIFGDYVAGFLGLGRDGNSWSMNPFDVSLILVSSTDHFSLAFQPIKTPSGERLGRGEGNHCSIEFNLLYRVSPISPCKCPLTPTSTTIAVAHYDC